MIARDIEAITREDIDALLANAVPEGRTIEYKEELPGRSDEEKREFLADVSSFANAAGGDVIYGVREKRDENGKATGILEAAEGLASINADAEKRRLEDILRDGIDPRIPGLRLKHLDGFPVGPVLVLRVPKSWASPHMVTFKNLSRFFSRTSAGKHPLDVSEIRAAFLASDSLARSIRGFRADRIAKLIADEGPLPLEPGPKVILHLLPVSAFAQPAAVDLKAVAALPVTAMRPIGSPSSFAPRFNFDGYLVSAPGVPQPLTYSYFQLFRTGATESVWTGFAREQALDIDSLESELLQAVARCLNLHQTLGIEPPSFLAISFVGLRGLLLTRHEWFRLPPNTQPIDRDVLLLPELAVEDRRPSVADLLRPAFDMIWQASGWPGKPS